MANDKCPLPKAKWGTFSAGPSSPGANPKTKLANAAFSCSKKEAGERGILGSTGGEEGGDGKRQKFEVRETHPARCPDADEDASEDEDKKNDDELTALVKKCTTPTPESAARGKAEEVESLEAVTLLPESAAKRDGERSGE